MCSPGCVQHRSLFFVKTTTWLLKRQLRIYNRPGLNTMYKAGQGIVVQTGNIVIRAAYQAIQ
jgi:hypothetical protein